MEVKLCYYLIWAKLVDQSQNIDDIDIQSKHNASIGALLTKYYTMVQREINYNLKCHIFWTFLGITMQDLT